MAKKSDFYDQYKDPRWQKKRLEIMERDGFMCQCCGESKSELNVHHKKYIKDKDLWDYDNKYLVTLCSNCHKETHLTKDRINDIICEVPELFLDNLCDLLPSVTRLDPYKQSALKDFINSLFPEKSNKPFYE